MIAPDANRRIRNDKRITSQAIAVVICPKQRTRVPVTAEKAFAYHRGLIVQAGNLVTGPSFVIVVHSQPRSSDPLYAAEKQAAGQRFRESLATDVLIAEVDGQVVGFLALTFIHGLSGLRALIDGLAVDRPHQRQGIGAALVEAAIQRADRRGATHLLVDTAKGDEAALDFYQACGFEPGGIAPLHIR